MGVCLCFDVLLPTHLSLDTPTTLCPPPPLPLNFFAPAGQAMTALASACKLTNITIGGWHNVTDAGVGAMVRGTPDLQVLGLMGCTQVGGAAERVSLLRLFFSPDLFFIFSFSQ